jgi:DNA-binding protein HU-beta
MGGLGGGAEQPKGRHKTVINARGKRMNKMDLVAAVAEAANLTKAEAGKAVDAVFDGIAGSLKDGDEVRLVGFGVFAVADRPAGTARNPRTGETIAVAASRQPKFRPGKMLKDALNGDAA